MPWHSSNMVKQFSKGKGSGGKGFDKKTEGFLNPRPKKDEQEFGPGKKGIIMCIDCNAYYYSKSWHHSLEGAIKGQTPEEFAEHEVKFQTCPACQMKKDKAFEGEVIIKLNDANDSQKSDILNAIHNSDEQAQDRDVMDKVLWIEDKGAEIRVYTSENQLAIRIGKKLDSAFKGGKLDINHSKSEDVARVLWEKP